MNEEKNRRKGKREKIIGRGGEGPLYIYLIRKKQKYIFGIERKKTFLEDFIIKLMIIQ